MQTVNGVEHAPSSAAAPPPVAETSAGTLQLPEDVKTKLKEPLPREAVSPNPQKPGLSVIKVIYVVERLNEVFGLNGWHVDNEVVETGRMVVVRATLSIPQYAIAIEQFGGNDNPDRGDAYKGACTDALSKCASYLGIGMDVYKGLYEQPGAGPQNGASSATRTPAPTATSRQNGAQSSGAPATGLTSQNMAARFSSMRTVLGAREYSEILGRHGFREVTGIPSLEKAREVYRVLLDAFRIPFGETRKALGSSEYAKILRELRLHPKAKLNPDQAVRVFNHMEETLNARQ
jgi:Rad52/22 family double-strand break repair protein